jgi:hypothetical protein
MCDGEKGMLEHSDERHHLSAEPAEIVGGPIFAQARATRRTGSRFRTTER